MLKRALKLSVIDGQDCVNITTLKMVLGSGIIFSNFISFQPKTVIIFLSRFKFCYRVKYSEGTNSKIQVMIYNLSYDPGNYPHGGVIIAVRQSLNPILIQMTHHTNYCSQILQQFIKKKFTLCICYRPPSMNIAVKVSFF